MRSVLPRLFLFVGLLTLASATPGAAGENSSAAPQVRAVIERQFDAFARDDAAGAYALASPGLKTIFTNADVFLTMVRTQYAPVYRHRSAEFGATTGEAGAVAQTVTLVDENERVWTALYKLERQPDGAWLITGCALIKSPDTAT